MNLGIGASLFLVATLLAAACKKSAPVEQTSRVPGSASASALPASPPALAPPATGAAAPAPHSSSAPLPPTGAIEPPASAANAELAASARATQPTNLTGTRRGCDDCRAPSYCTAQVCVEPGLVVARGKRGANFGKIPPEQFRYQDADESAELAPSGLAATDTDERLFVLDDLDRQIHVYRGGALEKVIQTPDDATFDHMVPLHGGRFLLNDGYGSRNVLHVLDQDGKALRKFPLEGKGFAEHEGPAGLYARKDGVWARHHGTSDGRGNVLRESYMVRVSDADGNPDSGRPMRTGFLSGDGRISYGVRVVGPGLEVTSHRRGAKASERKQTIDLPGPRRHLLAYDSDAAGRLYVLVEAERKSSAARTTLLIVLSPELDLVRQLEVPTRPIGHEVRTPLFVSPRGFAYYLDVREDELLVRRY